MKKITIALTALVMLLSVSSFAGEPEKVNATVKAAFEKNFNGASAVNWSKTEEFYFASFLLNSVYVEAAYTETGELLGTSRKITAQQMPLSVSLALGEKYRDFLVDEAVTEISFASVTSYHVTVSNERQVLRLKCFTDGSIQLEGRSKK